MDRKWLPLNALRAFEAAGQHLSFTAAANRVDGRAERGEPSCDRAREFSWALPCSNVARSRTARADRSRAAHPPGCFSKSFDRIDQALGEVIKEKGRPKRVLKVALPTSFAHRLAIPILRDFRSENAGISLRLLSKPTTGPEVDGDIDIAIVYAEPRSPTRSTISYGWCARPCCAARSCSKTPTPAIPRG